MAIVIPAGYAQLNVRMALANSTQTGECTFGVNFDDPLDCEQVLDAWATRMMANMTPNWVYVHGMARVQDGLIVEKTYNTAGGSGGSASAPNLCYLIRKVTSIPGRAHKGRMYLPNPVESVVDHTGLIQAAQVTAMNTQCNNFLADIAAAATGGFGLMVILHNQSVATPPPTNVDTLVCQQIAATQRRRMRG